MTAPSQSLPPSSIAISGIKLSVLGVLAVYSASRPILLVGLIGLVALSLAIPFLKPYPLRTRLWLGLAGAAGPLVGCAVFVVGEGRTLNTALSVLAVSLGVAVFLWTRYKVRHSAR